LKSEKREPHEWVAKAIWHSTALYLRVGAKDEAKAWSKAWGIVSRKEGGSMCLKVELVRQIR
jgi:hypothetical protein